MLNSIKLICEDNSEISSGEGAWGQWSDIVYCPDGTYLNGFQLKVQPPQGEEDDTATNGIIMFCNGTELTSKHNDYINFGNWSNPVMCPENQFIRGFNLQIQKDQGKNVDDKTLNNVRTFCN